MADTTTTPSNDQTTTPPVTPVATTEKSKAHKESYTTLVDAKKVTAPSAAFKVFTVTAGKGGKKVYVWGQSGDNAITVAARKEGWTAELTEKKRVAPVNPAEVVAGLTDEQLTEMLAARGLAVKKATGKK